MIRIFDHCNNAECVGYYRSLMPYLACRTPLRSEGIDLHCRAWWRHRERFDVYIFHRDIDGMLLEMASLLADAGKRIVYEADDDHLSWPLAPHDLHERILAIRELADLIVVHTPAMAAAVGLPHKTVVAPDLVDMSMCQRIHEFSQRPVRILWAASAPCPGDLDPAPALDRLTRRYRGGVIVDRIGGDHIPEFVGNPWINLQPLQPYGTYHAFMASLRPDVSICHRADHPFNRVKANIKWLESTQVGAACAVSDLPPYAMARDGEDVLKVPPGGDWYEPLDRLVNEPELRLALWRNSRERMANEFSWQSPAREVWLKMFRRAAFGSESGEAVLKASPRAALKAMSLAA